MNFRLQLHHHLVDVHFREFFVCCFLIHACRCGFVWVGWLVLWSLLPIDGSILCLLFLGRLHLRFGFGNHRVAS